MQAKRTIRDLDVREKKVLVRVDYNVPLSASGQVEDETRVSETVGTLRYLLDRRARVILASHLGRPEGQPDPRYSLKPVALVLERLLGRQVKFASDCVGQRALQAVESLEPGEVLLLENLRFHPGEEKNEPAFARQLADLADLFVSDAFGAAHRAHASTSGVAGHLPSVAGFLLEKELKFLSRLLENPPRPYLAILGGAKISDKLGVLKNLAEKVDGVLVGGAMAFTLLAAQGLDVGNSRVEEGFLEEARTLLERYPAKFLLPKDVHAAPSLENPYPSRTVRLSRAPGALSGLMGLDIGPETIRFFADYLWKAHPKTIFWNGPMGVFEMTEFAQGTLEIARILGECRKSGALVIVGGGDSVAALNKLGLASEMTHVSTGGGASLEFLEGKDLPGIRVLQDAETVSRS